MEMARNKLVFHESEQTNINNNTKKNLSNKRHPPRGILTPALTQNLRTLLKIVCGGSREICAIAKEEEEEENSDVNDGSMRSNNRNIRTEK